MCVSVCVCVCECECVRAYVRVCLHACYEYDSYRVKYFCISFSRQFINCGTPSPKTIFSVMRRKYIAAMRTT